MLQLNTLVPRSKKKNGKPNTIPQLMICMMTPNGLVLTGCFIFTNIQLFLLFVSDSLNWIQIGCFLGRIPTKEYPRYGTNCKAKHDTPRLDVNGPVSQRIYSQGSTYTYYNSNNTSGNTD